MLKRATQKDVAARAGVSRGVVSQVLHGSGGNIGVSRETAERVRKAAAELDYHPDSIARFLRGRRTLQIGMLHAYGSQRQLFSDPGGYFAALMDGIVDGAFRRGYTVALCPRLSGNQPEDAMLDGRFDGLVWHNTWYLNPARRPLEKCSVPLVALHVPASDFDNAYPAIICDNDQGIRLAVEHLVELGHRRIGFLYDHYLLFGESTMRMDAFLKWGKVYDLEVATIDLRDQWAGLDDYLRSGPPHTALIAYNDFLAIEATTALRKAGFSIPSDISIVGFDSTNSCDHHYPPLTSVRQPIREMGDRAADLLVDYIDGKIDVPYEEVFPCTLDVRASTAPPRKL